MENRSIKNKMRDLKEDFRGRTQQPLKPGREMITKPTPKTPKNYLSLKLRHS